MKVKLLGAIGLSFTTPSEILSHILKKTSNVAIYPYIEGNVDTSKKHIILFYSITAFIHYLKSGTNLSKLIPIIYDIYPRHNIFKNSYVLDKKYYVLPDLKVKSDFIVVEHKDIHNIMKYIGKVYKNKPVMRVKVEFLDFENYEEYIPKILSGINSQYFDKIYAILYSIKYSSTLEKKIFNYLFKDDKDVFNYIKDKIDPKYNYAKKELINLLKSDETSLYKEAIKLYNKHSINKVSQKLNIDKLTLSILIDRAKKLGVFRKRLDK